MSEWRDTSDGVDWPDGGKIELQRADGTVTTAWLRLDEVWTGEEEIPVPFLSLDGGLTDATLAFFDFEKWRPAKR